MKPKIMRAFTLIELMLVMSITVILSSFAISVYRGTVMQTHRVAAKQALMQLAQELERLQMIHHTYSYGIDIAAIVPSTERYDYAFRVPASADYYVLSATPIGVQNSDSCGVLLLDAKLIRGAGGVLANRAALTKTCWEK